jgi:hypothetical protein
VQMAAPTPSSAQKAASRVFWARVRIHAAAPAAGLQENELSSAGSTFTIISSDSCEPCVVARVSFMLLLLLACRRLS